MGQNFSTFAFTDSVKEAQTHYGSRDRQASVEQQPDHFTISLNEAKFIESRDGFYLSTTGDNGWPYMQFRGGPKGFLKVLGPRTLGSGSPPAHLRKSRTYLCPAKPHLANKLHPL